MLTLDVHLKSAHYPIHIGPGLRFDSALFSSLVGKRRVMIITQEKIAQYYLIDFEKTLADYSPQTVKIPDGEQHKNLNTFQKIIHELLEGCFHRDTVLIALGGGIVGDLTGFVAACYQRGIPFIQVPTTLLAQVDSSIGGKTAVNHALAKNSIGAFHQPAGVIIDTETLHTLPEREYRAGLAEIIKHALIGSREYWEFLQTQLPAILARDPATLTSMIYQSCQIKANIVMADERETEDQRLLLNYGHSLAHALETLTDYQRYLHGEAVAIGMMFAAKLSAALGLLSKKEVNSIESFLRKCALPTSWPLDFSFETLWHVLLNDKKQSQKGLRWIVLDSIACAKIVSDIPKKRIKEIFYDYC